jgi:hypothetical protein
MKNSKHKKVKKNNTKKKNNHVGGRGRAEHISRLENRPVENNNEELETTSNDSTSKLTTNAQDNLKSKFLRMINSKNINTNEEKDTDKEGSLGISVGVPATLGFQKGNPFGINFKFKSDSQDKKKKTVNRGLISSNKGLQKAQKKLTYTQQQYEDLGKQQSTSLAAQSAIEAISPFPINDQLMLPLEKYDGIMSGISKAIAKSNSKGLESSKLRNNFEDLIDLKVAAWLENAKIATDMRTNSNIISYAGNVIKQLKSFMEELNKFGLPLDQALDMLVSIASSITNQADEMQAGATGAMQAEADSRKNLDKESGHEEVHSKEEVKPKEEVHPTEEGSQSKEVHPESGVQESVADQQPVSGEESGVDTTSTVPPESDVQESVADQQPASGQELEGNSPSETTENSNDVKGQPNLMFNNQGLNNQGLDKNKKNSLPRLTAQQNVNTQRSFINPPSSGQSNNIIDTYVRDNAKGGTDQAAGLSSVNYQRAQGGGSKRSKNKKKKKNKSKKNKKNKKKFILNKSKNYLKISPFSYSDCKF